MLDDLHVNLSSSDSRVTASVLDTVGVIYEEDAVQARHWTNLDVKVCGKTGTAQRNTDNPMGWFIAYAPADDPKYVIGANMDEVLSGATSAMYVVRDVFGAIYGQPDDYAVESTVADG